MKKYVAAGIFLLLSLGFVALSLPQLEILELKSYDSMMSIARGPLPSPDELIIVAIDETSLAEFQSFFNWPWPRAIHGELINSLNRAGARAIGFDVVFAGETEEEEDGYMAEAIQGGSAPVVLAATREVTDDPRMGILTLNLLPADPFLEAGAHVGYATMNPDSDGALRMARLSVDDNPVLAVELYNQVAGPLDMTDIPVVSFEGEDPEIFINFAGPPRTIRTVSYYQALEPEVYLPEGTFQDKIVLVGRSMAVEDLSERRMEKDAFSIPFSVEGQMPGVEVHANALNTLLTGTFIDRASVATTWILMILLPLLVSGIVLGFDSFRLKIVLSLLVIAGYEAMAVALFVYQSYWIYTVQPLFVMVSVFGLNTLYQYRLSEKERAHIRKALKGYVSSQVMNEVMKNPNGLELGGTQVEATVLFSDIAGFSQISEKTTPRELFALLNEYFTRIGDVIMAREGMINKYIGDAVMAIWNTPLAHENHAALACQAALEMKRIVEEMPPLKARIGINTGPMVAGNLGHAERMEYTVIGDAVNLASRLEGANKPFGTAIMISDTTEQLVRGRFLLRQLDRIRVIGKEQPVSVYEVLAGIDEQVPEALHEMVQSFERITEAYEARDWEKACSLAEAHVKVFKEDHVTEIYLERCRQFAASPPPVDWDGVFALKSK